MKTSTKSPAANLNVAKLKQWAKSNQELAFKLIAAQAFAAVERERVDAYILPVFQKFTFTTSSRFGEVGPIATPRDIYLSDDDALCAEYFEACDKAHREHGFTGKSGYCPALIAETKVTEAEWDLLAAGAPLFGMAAEDARGICGKLREDALKILTGVCVLSAKE